MKVKWIILSAVLVVFMTSGSRCVDFNGITGSKNYITRDFKVGNFDKIDALTVADINYTQSADSTTSLQIYGSDNFVELVSVDIRNNTLYLSMKKKNIRNGDLKIDISSPNLVDVKLKGVGDFSIKNITCASLDVSTSGVGNIRITGKAETVSLNSEGVGDIKASDLIARNVKAQSNGVGNISCYAAASIYARINGVGSISYKGNPELKDLKKNGVGSIKQR